MASSEKSATADKYTITAALPYTNGPVHIGHLAGVYVPADIYARYQRLQNKDVAFICGSDEHGVAITLKAKKEGISPQEVVDKYHAIIKKSFEDFGISFDNYSRTSAEIHHKTASEFFRKMYDAGQFGLMRQLDIFPPPKNGQKRKAKIGKIIGRMKARNSSILLVKTILCSIALFSRRC